MYMHKYMGKYYRFYITALHNRFTPSDVTARLTVRVKHQPDGEFDWSNSAPQKSRNALTIDDLIPNQSDGEQLHKRAVDYVMYFLIVNFQSLYKLRQFAPTLQSPLPVSKSVVAPMKILPYDEKYTEENIHILKRIQSDAQLSGDPQVTNR